MSPNSLGRREVLKALVKEDREALARLEWHGGLYRQNGTIVYPTASIRKCLINTATINRQGKAVIRALSFETPNIQLAYTGPKDIGELCADPKFHDRRPVKVGSARVMRYAAELHAVGAERSGVPDGRRAQPARLRRDR